jgi:hypothetical protein
VKWTVQTCAVAVAALAWTALPARAADADKDASSSTAASHESTAAAETTADASGGEGAAQKTDQPSGPLAIHVGDADLVIGGFMDATVINRSTNVGSGIGTNFGTIPFSNTYQGNLSETKFSAQNSRLTLAATSRVGSANVKGYVEVDFLGNAPNGLNVTSNSDTLRLRLYWVQLRTAKFEFLAGQSWSFMTPNRRGLSPEPGDLFYSQDVDTNYQMGLTWERTMQFRFIGHFSDMFAAGLSLSNPEQYVGSAVVLPAAFPAGQVDQGTTTTTVPNPFSDIVFKVAFDPKTAKETHQHIDAAFLFRGFKTYNPVNSATDTSKGTGGSVNAVLELVKNFRLALTSFYSSGGGRYIANTNIPDFIVNKDFTMTTVKSRAYIVGPEFVFNKELIYGYYSWVNADPEVSTDVCAAPALGAAPVCKQIGFGVTGGSAANKNLKEGTFGITHTFFRDPKIGGMQLMFQYSYVKRTPFSVPAGTPTDAHTNMVYVNVRYLLP